MMGWITKHEARVIARKMAIKKNLVLSPDDRADLLIEMLKPVFEDCERALKIHFRRSCETQKQEVSIAVSARMRAKAAALVAGEYGEPTEMSEAISAMPLTTYENLPPDTFRGIL